MSTSGDRLEAHGGRHIALSSSAALLLRLGLAIALPTLAYGTAAVAQDPATERPVQRAVVIRLNGERLAQGLVVVERGREGAWVRVADLRHAVDGSTAGNRLRNSGRELHAIALGGCAACRFRVVRQVVISRRVRVWGDEPHVPLEDVVRAFEAKVSQDPGASVIHLHVGECRWCILEPRPKEARAASGAEVPP
jgi:hypothetical protein